MLEYQAMNNQIGKYTVVDSAREARKWVCEIDEKVQDSLAT